MLAKLNRNEFIELLEKLGDEADEVALTAARDIHARITVVGIGWDGLLVPEQSDADPAPAGEEELDEEPDDDLDEEPDDDLDDEPDDAAGEEPDDAADGETDDAAGEEPDDAADGEPDDAADHAQLTAEEREEALSLMASLLKKGVSADTKEELEGYREDLDENEFTQSDLKYLRALNKRVAGHS